jgi:hypothetical protein
LIARHAGAAVHTSCMLRPCIATDRVLTHALASRRSRAIDLTARSLIFRQKAGLLRRTAGSGVVTRIQPLCSALNLNVHCHMLLPDGVCSHDPPQSDRHDSRVSNLTERPLRALSRLGGARCRADPRSSYVQKRQRALARVLSITACVRMKPRKEPSGMIKNVQSRA